MSSKPVQSFFGRLLEKLGLAADRFRTWVGPTGEDDRALDSEFESKARSVRAKLLGGIFLVAVLLRLAFWLSTRSNGP